MFRPQTDDYKQWSDHTARPYAGVSSLTENFQAAVGQVVDEESSYSRYLHDEGFRERNKSLRDMINDGTIPDDVYRQSIEHMPKGGIRVNYDSLTKYANEFVGMDELLNTDEELIKKRDTMLDSRRRYREQIYDTAQTGGKIAQFGGMFVGASIDPVNVAAAIVAAPAYGAQATTRAMYTLAAARRGFLAGSLSAVKKEKLPGCKAL